MMMMMKGLMSWDAASTQTTNLSEEKGEPKRNRAEAPLLTSVTPYRLAKPATPVTRVSLVKYWVNSLPQHVAAWLWEVTPANNLRRLFGKTDQRYYSKCSVVSLDGWVKCPRWRSAEVLHNGSVSAAVMMMMWGFMSSVGGGGGDSSVVRAPDSWLKGRGFESLLERRENFLLQGRLSVLTLISVSVPPPCYHSST